MTSLLQEAIDRHRRALDAMPPLERAIHRAKQRRSMLRGLLGRDPGPDLLLVEIERLQAKLAKRPAQSEAEAQMEAMNKVLAESFFARVLEHAAQHLEGRPAASGDQFAALLRRLATRPPRTRRAASHG